jgi:hypothetical protein
VVNSRVRPELNILHTSYNHLDLRQYESSPSYRALPLYYLSQRSLSLWQPEGHVHRTVQIDSSRQFFTGLLSPSGPGVQGAEVAVAVRDERAHAEFLG